MSNSIAKNTAFITSAYVGQKIISFVYFTLIARNIGAENTGKYFFALSFTTVFVVFVDLGLTNVLVRESAKIKERAQEYFSTILSVKILLGLLSYLAAFVVINLMGYSVEIKYLVYLSALTMLFDSLHLSIYGVMRAMGNLKYEAVGIVGSQFLTLIFGLIFLYTGQPLIYLILAFVIPSFVNVCFAGLMLKKNYGIKLSPHYNKEIFKYLGRIAIPFALAAVFARVYSYIDSIILSKLAGNLAVGWYSIPYKITFAFQFIPLALTAALYPRFSEYYVANREKLAYYFERGVMYLMIIVVPIAIGISVLAKDIVLSLYTVEYLPSILPLQILMASLIFSFLSFPVGSLLNACNRQATQTTITFIILVLNIALNFLLIPEFGVTGAAIAALVGNILLTVLGYLFVSTTARINHWFLFKNFLLLLISGIVMGLVVRVVTNETHYLIGIGVGMIIYCLMLFITRTVTREQLKEAIILIRK